MAHPCDVVGPSPGSGEAEAPPRSGSSRSSEVKVMSKPWVGRGGVRRLPGPRPSPIPESGEAEFVVFRDRARVRALGSGEAEFVVFRGRARVRALGRARRSSSSSGAEPESEPWGRATRSSSSSGAEPESEPWAQARWSFLWRPRPYLAAVSLTLSSGTAVGATQAALSSCQAGQWSGEVTAVTFGFVD
jgi:hypothetical protein